MDVHTGRQFPAAGPEHVFAADGRASNRSSRACMPRATAVMPFGVSCSTLPNAQEALPPALRPYNPLDRPTLGAALQPNKCLFAENAPAVGPVLFPPWVEAICEATGDA